MYISKVVIENYRCFGSKTEIKLKSGVNVFIGENNSGKTTVLNALGFLFDRQGRSQLGIDDFSQALRKMSTTLSIQPGSISMMMLRLKLREANRA
jgi:putative ATP-dependent endonuclease of OLD family